MTQTRIDLTGRRYCCFDAYGTLFDVHAAINRHQDRIGSQSHSVSALWRSKQLEYSWVYSLCERYQNFWQLTVQALDYALASFDIKDQALRQDLLDAYSRLDCYTEVKPTLAELQQQSMGLAILSNGTKAMIDAALQTNGLEQCFDAIITVESLQRYKTTPIVYQTMLDKLGIKPKQCLFFSSNRWDIAGATAFGLDCVWVNRMKLPDEYPELAPIAIRPDLTCL
ncbi:MAG: haloacid dehalogenase type II [Pseudomonadota bacterium]